MRRSADSYENIVNKALGLVEKLDSLGIWPKRKEGRYQYYIKLVSELNIARDNDKVEDFLRKYNSDGHFWFILKQLYELTSILGAVIEALESGSYAGDKEELVSRVKIALSGPHYPKDENPKNSAPRNAQFELLVFSKLYKSGNKDLRSLLNPDILALINARRYPIECKRVLGETNRALVDAIHKGVKQIKDNWNPEYFSGVVAVDISAKYEKGNSYLECASHESGNELVQSQLEQDFEFVYNNCPKLKEAAKEQKMVGFLLSVSAVYILKDKSDMGWINEIALGVMDRENPSQAPIFISDFKTLEYASLGV